MEGSDFDLSGLAEPARPEPRGWSSWPPAARWTGGLGVGCAVLVVIGGLALWGLMALAVLVRPPRGMAAEVVTPPAVTLGAKFPLKLTVRNEGTGKFTVTNVTAPKTVLNRLTLENPKPAPASTQPVFTGDAIWSYQKPLAPGEKWTVTFDATPKEAGGLKGRMLIQALEAPMSPLTVPFRLDVRPAAKR